MADSTNKAKPGPGLKALPGSFELRREALGKAIKDADILPAGDVWVSDTFDDYVVVCVWSRKAESDDGEYYDYETHHYKVMITAESEDGFEFGEVTEVEKTYTESLTVVGAKRAPGAPGAGPSAPKGASHSKARSPFKLKSLTAVDDEIGGWEGEGCFSVFDYEDHSKDVVRAGSTKRSTAVHLPKILDHHGVTVGQSTKAYEDDEGLQVAFRIYPTRAGEDLVKLMRPIETDLGPHAPVEQGSIGFSPLEGGAKRRKGGGWEYTDLWIWEVSPVTFGDNDATTVGLKSLAEVNTMPTAELAAHAGEVLNLAVDGADGVKALHLRRVKEGRDLSDAQWALVDSLALDALEAATSLLTLKDRSGKVASAAALRHARGLVDSLAALVHGPAEAPAADNVGADALDAPAETADKTQPEHETKDDNLDGGTKDLPSGDESRSKDLPEDDFAFELALVDLGIDLGQPASQE